MRYKLYKIEESHLTKKLRVKETYTLQNPDEINAQIDKLEEKVPGIRVRILTGSLTVMMTHMSALLKMPAEQIEKIAGNGRIHQLVPPPEYYTPVPQHRKPKTDKSVKVEPAIKKMPEFDPDADVNGLRYTVSAWRNAIARTALQADLRRATPAGKNSLKQELRKLIFDTDNLCRILDIPQEGRLND